MSMIMQSQILLREYIDPIHGSNNNSQ